MCNRTCGYYCRERAHDVDVLMQQSLNVRQGTDIVVILNCSMFSFRNFGCSLHTSMPPMVWLSLLRASAWCRCLDAAYVEGKT